MEKKQARVILWASPRSASTPFYRAISQNEQIKTMYQPFKPAHFYGPERFSDLALTDPEERKTYVTFNDVLKQYHDPYEGYEAVFCKEVAYALRGRLGDAFYIPKGYIHTFLIRNPATVLESNYRIFLRHHCSTWNPYFVAYEELHQIFKLVSAESEVLPIIIDADDLIDNPERILREYCRRTGLPFVSQMLHWKTTDLSIMLSDDDKDVYQKALIDTNSFEKPDITKKDLVQLPKVVKDCIEHVMPIYNDMYKNRLQLQD